MLKLLANHNMQVLIDSKYLIKNVLFVKISSLTIVLLFKTVQLI